jgi:hypothetical protein
MRGTVYVDVASIERAEAQQLQPRFVLETARDDQTRVAQYLRADQAIGGGCMHSKLCVINQFYLAYYQDPVHIHSD